METQKTDKEKNFVELSGGAGAEILEDIIKFMEINNDFSQKDILVGLRQKEQFILYSEDILEETISLVCTSLLKNGLLIQTKNSYSKAGVGGNRHD